MILGEYAMYISLLLLTKFKENLIKSRKLNKILKNYIIVAENN